MDVPPLLYNTANRFRILAHSSLCKLASNVASILTNSIDALSMQLLHMTSMDLCVTGSFQRPINQ
jgi:hypothetical protein